MATPTAMAAPANTAKATTTPAMHPAWQIKAAPSFSEFLLTLSVFLLALSVFPLTVSVFPLTVSVFPLALSVLPLALSVFMLEVASSVTSVVVASAAWNYF